MINKQTSDSLLAQFVAVAIPNDQALALKGGDGGDGGNGSTGNVVEPVIFPKG